MILCGGKMKHLIKPAGILILVSALLLSVACASESSPAAPPAPYLSKTGAAGRAYAPESNDSSGSGEAATTDRKIVRTGSISMEVSDLSKSQAEITDIANLYKGYVVSSSQNADKEYPSGFISIRVPADKFNDALLKTKALAVKVTTQNTNSEDVTEQYTDLQAQLHNYEATEAQYLELLKKADNVKDILEVQRELSNVRGNIERVKGRIQYLDRTSDMSLIEITLKKSRPIGESTWDISGIFKSAVDGLIVFGQLLAGLLIWLLVFSPVWVTVVVIIMVIRHRKKSKDKLPAQK